MSLNSLRWVTVRSRSREFMLYFKERGKCGTEHREVYLIHDLSA